jgi:hypothetical protein
MPASFKNRRPGTSNFNPKNYRPRATRRLNRRKTPAAPPADFEKASRWRGHRSPTLRQPDAGKNPAPRRFCHQIPSGSRPKDPRIALPPPFPCRTTLQSPCHSRFQAKRFSNRHATAVSETHDSPITQPRRFPCRTTPESPCSRRFQAKRFSNRPITGEILSKNRRETQFF